jgi:hypothetical protein
MVIAMLHIFPAKCQGSVFGNPVLVLKKKTIMVAGERKVIYFINEALQNFTFFLFNLLQLKILYLAWTGKDFVII